MDPKIKELINLTDDILNKETSYSDHKMIISDYFDSHPITLNLEDKEKLFIIKRRLILIDWIYSTNIGLNRFGLEDLAKAIFQFKTDEELKKQSVDLIENLNDKNPVITKLFNLEYGQKNRKTKSLISKYLYFLNEYKFPIYDSLVKKQIKYSGEDILKFVEIIKKINEELNINDFDKLDQLFWVKGKIESSWVKDEITHFQYEGLLTKEELKIYKEVHIDPKEITDFKKALEKINLNNEISVIKKEVKLDEIRK